MNQRLILDNWSICGNTKIGHYHKQQDRNCQDHCCYDVVNNCIIGVVSDGCSDGKHSEVGAKLISEQILWMLRKNVCSSNFDIDYLFWPLQNYLFHMVNSRIASNLYLLSDEEVATILREYFSATILGLIIKDDYGLIFNVGDGIWCLNSDNCQDINHIDQNNTPNYFSHACVRNPEKFGLSAPYIPKNFNCHFFNPNEYDKIMIATDGFITHNTDLLNLHGQQWDKRGNFGLAKWMNMKYREGYFYDDCAIITVEKQIKLDKR